MVVMITAILTVLVSSYLILTANQNMSVARSVNWNTAMPVAEAGVEEALAQVNKNLYNYAADSWSQSGTNFTSQRYLGSNYYNVTISGTDSVVTITSTGYAQQQGTNCLSRTVQITAATWVYRQIGLVAKTISFGGNLGVDSYDSSSPLSSTAYNYDPLKASANATVGSTGPGFGISSFGLGGNSHVKGYVTASASGSVSVSGSASVGDSLWLVNGVQPGHYTNGFTPVVRDVRPPFLSAAAPAAGTVSGTNYSYVLNGGKYMAGNVDSGGSTTTMMVTKPSVLYVTTNVNLGSITFAPGARLDLYVSMPSLNFAPTLYGGGAAQFTVWGLPTCTSMTINANTLFTGVIYAPEMSLHANGGASICGSVLANSFDCSGTFDFHYDLATANSGVASPVIILSWAEL